MKLFHELAVLFGHMLKLNRGSKFKLKFHNEHYITQCTSQLSMQMLLPPILIH